MANNSKKIYFASDVHLGAPYIKDHRVHENRFVHWLDSIKHDAEAIYLVGDIFDFWWEYRKVVPRGFVRTLGKIAELTDSGIPVHFFIGNHDIWTWDYLSSETGMIVHKEPMEITLHGKRFFITHGDGLGDPSKAFRIVRKAFHSPILQKLFAAIVPPSWAIALGQKWSHSSRESEENVRLANYLGEDNEHLVQYAKQVLTREHFDYFVFGHRHIVLDLMIQKNSHVVILGDWIGKFSYGVLENTGQFYIDYYEEPEQPTAVG